MTKRAWDKPGLSLLVALGSLIVHADECLGSDGRILDQKVFQNGLNDPAVKSWLDEGTKMGLLPVKR